MSDWLEDAIGVPLPMVAQKLGLPIRKKHLPCCPACGCIGHGSGKIFRHVTGRWKWKCHRCDARGDGLDLVALTLLGSQMQRGASVPVRDWFASAGWGMASLNKESWTRPPPIVRPAPGELRRVLRRCRRPSERSCGAAREWMASRGLDPARAPCGILDAEYTHWPAWWPRSFARRWPLIVAACDPKGMVTSIHGRAIGPQDRKVTWPHDRDAGGLLFADPWVARAMLRRRPIEGPLTIIVAEGVTDYLAAAQQVPQLGGKTGVLGITSGSCRALEQVAWPRDTTILAATDPDEAGERYLHRIVAALSPIPVRRLVKHAG